MNGFGIVVQQIFRLQPHQPQLPGGCLWQIRTIGGDLVENQSLSHELVVRPLCSRYPLRQITGKQRINSGIDLLNCENQSLIGLGTVRLSNL